MQKGVLAHVAAAFTQKENLATAALAYILTHSEACRRGFQTAVERAIGPIRTLVAVRTEEVIDDAKRPDVFLAGPDGSCAGYMEVKFWAGLTEGAARRLPAAARGRPGWRARDACAATAIGVATG
jgi:hypothetical protein